MLLTCICYKTLEHITVSSINNPLAFLLTVSMVSEVRGLAKPNWFSSTMTDHKQTDVVIMNFATIFDKVPHRRLLYKLDIMGLEDLLTSGSAHDSLSALKKWYWMVMPQIQSRSYLVSPEIGLRSGPFS